MFCSFGSFVRFNMESTMTFKVPIRTKLAKMCGDNGRFRLGHIEVSPATIDGHVFIAATDARAAIVIQQPGECEEAVLIKGSDLPASNNKLKTAELTRTASGDVRCEVNGGTESSAVAVDTGRMANIHDILPVITAPNDPSEEPWVQISLSPRLLMNWCEAAGALDSNHGIALFVKPPPRGGSQSVTDGICALEFRDTDTGRHCIGAIMPLTPENNTEQIAAQRYEATRKCFMAAKSGNPMNNPNLITVEDQETLANSATIELDALIKQTQEASTDAD
jgi:hypothetical protein